VLALAPLAGPAVARSKSSANGRLPALLDELLDDELLEDDELDELDEELLEDDELLEDELEEPPPPGCGFQPAPSP
jgi:hypothetical protein